MIYFIIILCIVLGISIYLNVIQNKKLRILETYCGKYLTELFDLKDKIIEADEVMNQIDKNGAFSSDDEIGTVFKIIKDCISYLNGKTNFNENGENK